MAAWNDTSPACAAWMEHWPIPPSVTILAETVQTVGVIEAKATGRPELAVALMVKGALVTT